MQKKDQQDILALDIDKVTKEFNQWQRDSNFKNIIKNLINPEKRTIKALDELSFQVKKGEFMAYAGANGSGKSTTIKILSGILHPTSGHVSVLGMNPKKDRVALMSKIGILFGQRSELWWDHPVITSYEWKKQIWNIPEETYKKNLNLVIELLDLSQIINTFARELSLGQRLRADIGMLLLHDPELIFLDEPTLGLDVLGKKRVISFLKEINKFKGTTIVVTSHDMSDLEEMADRIILLSNGKIVFDDSFKTLRTIKKSFTSYKFSYLGTPPKLEGVELKESDGYNHEYISLNENLNMKSFLLQLSEINGVENIEVSKIPIEDVISEIYLNKGVICNERISEEN